MKIGDKECVVGSVICPARTGESSAEGAERRSGDTKIRIIILAMLLASPQLSSAQYFQHLFDNDSSQDWGWSINQQNDGNYFVQGWSFNQNTDKSSMYNMTISSDGNNILHQYQLLPGMDVINIGSGLPGEMKNLPNGDYILPATMQWPNASTHYAYSSGALVKLNSIGDTVFFKIYIDTANHFDVIYALSIVINKGYLLGGVRGTDTPSVPYAYVIRTDSIGDTVWTHTYQKIVTQDAIVNNILPLPDGRIVLGAMSTYVANGGPPHYITYYHNTPWFLVLDSTGNVLKDTLYGVRYSTGASAVCGELYPDKNGGYINIGYVDTMYTPDPSDVQNLPGYIAHLDTNFRITWITSFPYSADTGHRQGVLVRQLMDSSYIIVGDSYGSGPYDKGFAAKINRTGDIVWSHNYYSDETHDAYLRDVVERPDGGFVMTGGTFNDTLPAWHQHQDMWLVGVDSNGCEDGLCAPAAVPAAPQPVVKGNELLVYPNPTNSILNFEFPVSGNVTIKLMDITGRVLDEQQVANSATAAFSVRNYTPGLYLYQFITANTTRSGKFIVQ